MTEYKIIKSEFHWKDNIKKFEDLINKYAQDGWKVSGFSTEANTKNRFLALLERNKSQLL